MSLGISLSNLVLADGRRTSLRQAGVLIALSVLSAPHCRPAAELQTPTAATAGQRAVGIRPRLVAEPEVDVTMPSLAFDADDLPLDTRFFGTVFGRSDDGGDNETLLRSAVVASFAPRVL